MKHEVCDTVFTLRNINFLHGDMSLSCGDISGRCGRCTEVAYISPGNADKSREVTDICPGVADICPDVAGDFRATRIYVRTWRIYLRQKKTATFVKKRYSGSALYNEKYLYICVFFRHERVGGYAVGGVCVCVCVCVCLKEKTRLPNYLEESYEQFHWLYVHFLTRQFLY